MRRVHRGWTRPGLLDRPRSGDGSLRRMIVLPPSAVFSVSSAKLLAGISDCSSSGFTALILRQRLRAGTANCVVFYPM